MWYLLTDRKLTGFQLYGPFSTPEASDETARKLMDRGRIKGWTVVMAQVPPRFSNGEMATTAYV